MEHKPIKDFEDYLISSSGKIFSLKRQIYRKPGITTKGYYQIGLSQSGKQYRKYIARLVAQAFIPNPDNKPEVNHKDGNKANNNVSNLEWVTAKENIQHAITILNNPPGKPKVSVKAYSYFTGKFLSIHSSLSNAARMHGVSQGNISSILTGRLKQTGGLTFKRTMK